MQQKIAFWHHEEEGGMDLLLTIGIEVDLGGGEESSPTTSYTRYQFDCSKLPRTPAISDHWVFRDPFVIDKLFEITYDI